MDGSKEFEYVITCLVPICPKCGAMLHNRYDRMMYVCGDCKSAFKVIKNGQSEHELVCNEIPKEFHSKERPA